MFFLGICVGGIVAFLVAAKYPSAADWVYKNTIGRLVKEPSS